MEPAQLEWRFGREGDEHGPLGARRRSRSPGASTASTSARAARRSCATTRARARPPGARLGGGRLAPGRALHARGARAARPRAGRRALPAAVGARLAAARARARRRRRAATSRPTWSTRTALEAALERGARARARDRRARCAPARSRRAPRSARRRAARTRRSAGRADERAVTATPGASPSPPSSARRSTTATARALLAANAGSGKTAVMAERCVEAVLQDGVPVGSILALTFTEKAAGELRDRIRRRFIALGRGGARARGRRAAGSARSTASAPACCARGRSPPGSTRASRCSTRAPRSGSPRDAYDARVRGLGRGARAAGGRRRRRVRGRAARARARAPTRRCARAAQTRPVLPIPPPRRPTRIPAELAAARAEAARCLAHRGRGKKLEEALAALESCDRALAEARRAGPGRARRGRAQEGRRRRSTQAPCAAYRAAWTAYRQGCADHHARLALVADRRPARPASAPPTRRRRPARAGLDFEDLELRRPRPARRRRRRRASAGPSASALIMVDEFQDTNRLQLDILEALERDNLFAVGDEFQSIYGFRHADVTIFRERRGRARRRPRAAADRQLPLARGAAGRPQRRASRRSGPSASRRCSPAATRRRDSGELRLFDPGEPAAPSRASSCW